MKHFQFNLCCILNLFIFLLFLQSVNADCKKQVPKDCEPICINGTCELRVVVILPDIATIESSINRVEPVLALAEIEIYAKQLISKDITIKYIIYDDKCDASFSTIYSMDAYSKDCAHLIIGPSCDYALATVARIIKHFRYDGMPLITPAGYSHDFIKKKTDCEDEFYMLIRTGLLSYARIAEFILALTKHYNWSQVVYFYERNGQYNVAGLNTCYLLMQSMAEHHRKEKLAYKSFATDASQTNMTENLKREIGVDQANAFFGLLCDYVLAPISRYAGVWKIPVISVAGLAEAFSFKTNFRTLTRMMGSYRMVGAALRGILQEFNWNVVGMLYHNHDESSGIGNSDCFNTLASIFRAVNRSSVIQRSFNQETADYSLFKDKLIELKNQSRIIIMCGNPGTIRNIMLAADELNMVDSGEYVFFNIELFSSMSNATVFPWYNETDTQANNDRAKNAYSALLQVTAKQPDNVGYKKFSDEVKTLAATKYNFTFDDNEPVSTFVTAFYDSMILYALALNDTITELGEEILHESINGSEIVKRMWNRNFTGITGNVMIDGNGDRVSDYSLWDMEPNTGRFEIVANYFHDKGLEYVSDKKIHWSGDRTTAPPDKPLCGFDNSLCPDNSLPGYAILSMILGFTVILMIIISIFGYRHYRLEAEINSMTWKVNWNDVLPCIPNSKHRSSRLSLNKRSSQITIQSEDLGSLGGDKQLYIPVGFYKGNKVAIKRINVQGINLNRDLMLQLKKMKDLQHDHLVRFYGACVDPPDSCILTEYCPKGSLQDILENEQIKLDIMFKLSLMHDIVRGMHFLHSTDIHSHGSLKSSNCVVDSRFVLKITDFGLYDLRKLNDERYDDDGSYAYWKKHLWTAPEILRMANPPIQGTQKGDVYSFAIIVHEIITRQGPFYLGDDEPSPKEIIEQVKNLPKNPALLFRPTVDKSSNFSYNDINNMMEKCWSEDPTERPDFNQLKTNIRRINKENESGNLLDNLLKRMEMYANNLEFLVEERTHDYLEEKHKCEELLYQLLPKSVAAQLIKGQSVVAETYDQVTIYFSDIVGFTNISAESTPMQVVDLLNDLYTCFDSIVENYDVYKVETIGDAYMVVSGLPVRNGNCHVREICRLALALLKTVRTFKIRHRPNEQIKLRIGLHSGPCVAGVVGLKMPRYCLFGDTVNTASRMESNGEALKIHMSDSTKNLLQQFTTFNVTKRGVLDIKGKGQMITYWLDGEDVSSERDINRQNNKSEESSITDQPPVSILATVNGNLKNVLNQQTTNKDNRKLNNANTNIPNFNNLKSINNNTSKNQNIIKGGQQYKRINNMDDENLKNCNIKTILVKN